MTTSRAISPDESLPIGVPSSPSTNSGAAIIQRSFHASRPLALPNTISLEALTAEFEADEAMAQHMATARQELAPLLYGEGAQTLSALRLASGLSQSQLAQRVGTSQPHIARIERGNNDPTTEVVARIAVALGVDEGQAFMAIRRQRVDAGVS